ncbi:hypothetical protein RYX36_017859, partial [Vicia faba]
MNSLQFRYALSPHSTNPRFSRTFPPLFHFPTNSRFLSFTKINATRRIARRKQGFSIRCSSKTDSQIEKNDERPPFDINLAVILAGFAFEAYTTPPEIHMRYWWSWKEWVVVERFGWRLNPERIGGDFKQEVQVHSGFLSAYDSVRTRIISLIRLAIGYV